MVTLKLEPVEITVDGDPMTFFVQEGTKATVEQAIQTLGTRVAMAERRPHPTQTRDAGKTLARVKWGDREYECTPVPAPEAEKADAGADAPKPFANEVPLDDDDPETAETEATTPPSEG